MNEKKKRISWKRDIREKILEALETNPEARFPTVRSIWYYLFGALQVIPGTERTYKKVDELVVAMRKGGGIPFGRFKVKRGEDGFGADIAMDPEYLIKSKLDKLLNLPETYELPKLYNQPFLIEVWVEKVGLMPTFETICTPLDIKVRSPEGFSPWEFCYRAVNDFKTYFEQRKSERIIILYFGDQDPSGENIYESLMGQLDFFGVEHDTRRLGVTIDQIRAYNLPKTPLEPETLAKIRRDSRYPKYIHKYGREIFCELDAFLSLAYDEFKNTLESAIEPLIDMDAISERDELNRSIKDKLDQAITPDHERLEDVKRQIIERFGSE